MPSTLRLRRRRCRPTLTGIDGRLDEGKLDQLRAWGTGLGAHESPDVRATGKAILMLIEEIERLHVDLWNAKAASADGGAAHETQADIDSFDADEPQQLAQSLRDRVSRLRRHA